MQRRRPGLCAFGHVEVHREENFILVAKVHQRAERQPLGRRKLQRASGDALWQRPLNMRRLARVAGDSSNKRASPAQA